MEQRWPSSVSVRKWEELTESDRRFFCFQDDYLPLPSAHAAQIGLLSTEEATRLSAWAFASIPPGWPEWSEERFSQEEVLRVQDCWNDPIRRSDVKRWLFDRGIPFDRTVYLIYEQTRVVQTTWKLVVLYWDALAWSVGYAMFAVDHTLSWTCCFHHENIFVFGSRRKGVE